MKRFHGYPIMNTWIGSLFVSNIKRVGFEDILTAIHSPDNSYLIINTLPLHQQFCLIHKTTPAQLEESAVNDILNNTSAISKSILIYGRNGSDDTVEKKYRQLVGLGLVDVYVYSGGLFEWLLLQDIYGEDMFPTMGSKVDDLLRYRELPVFRK